MNGTHKIKFFRRLAGISQWELAAAIGKSQAHISQIERAQTTPSAEDLDRIADALGVEVRALLPSNDK